MILRLYIGVYLVINMIQISSELIGTNAVSVYLRN